MRKSILVLIVLMISNISFGSDLRINGQFENYTGLLIENGDYAKVENSFRLKMEYNKGMNRLFVNPIIQKRNEMEQLDISLKEAYIDKYFKNFDLRVGKQQIIWGKANGVFVTDLISPKNLDEFILPDFNEVRIPINAVKLNYYIGNNNLEMIWIPEFHPNELPESDSIWAPEKPAGFETAKLDQSNLKLEKDIRNSEFAVKYSSLNEFGDYEILAAYLWSDIPLNYMHLKDGKKLIKPEYKREALIGGTFSKTFDKFVFRNEVAIYKDKKFQIEDISVNGVESKNYVNYVFGIDYDLFGLNLGNQIIQEYIFDYEEKMINDEINTTITTSINKSFLRETLTNQLFIYYNLNNSDALIKSTSNYSFGDGLNLTLGANIFVGDEGEFGQFDKNDLLFSKLKFDF
ncbi:MAG: DUF1302 family protein [Fusobacteriota bacterium]